MLRRHRKLLLLTHVLARVKFARWTKDYGTYVTLYVDEGGRSRRTEQGRQDVLK
jgi:hypothetical protein